MNVTHTLGIDIGGSGIKGAPVDITGGTLVAERIRIETPRPATVDGVAASVRSVVDGFPKVDGSVGCTFPAIVHRGRIRSAANVHEAWVGVDAGELFSEWCGRQVHVVNDADAAGLAEATFGVAVGRVGVVMVLTLGTGIGSALINDGVLVPNTELGHLEIDGSVAELFASNRARKETNQSFEDWTPGLNRYLAQIERLFSPDLIVLGGGVSKKFAEFGSMLITDAPIVPAQLRNDAGIVGAAMWASRQSAFPV